MKKTSFHTMALLLVPWLACNNPSQQNIAKHPPIASAVPAPMILPDVKDTTLPSGRKNIYLSGSRTKTGFFVERSIFPAGYKGMPHVHNADLYVTVLDGSGYVVMGNTFDTSTSIKPYGPGSFFIIPADKPHYEWFTQQCTMQIEGIGPNETFYIAKK